MKKLILKYHFWIIGILGMLLNSCSTSYKAVSESNGAKKIYNLKYGEDSRNIMDVFLPANYSAESPLVMLVHGGAWIMGNKAHLRSIQKFLFKNDIPSVSINYRLLKKDVNYQTQEEDINKAVETTLKSASEWNLNAKKIILLGESAGGHLALLYGFHHPDQISKLISLSGPTDFYSDHYLKSSYHQKTKGIFQRVVGEKYSPENLESFKKASPLHEVSNVPTLIFQGDRDFLVNRKQGISLDSVMTAKNFPHEFIYMKNSGHVPRFVKKKRENIIFPAILKFIKTE